MWAGAGKRITKEKGEINSQPFQHRLNIRKFEKDGPIRDLLIVEHYADAPDDGRKADVLGAGQVVKNNPRLSLSSHVVVYFAKVSISSCSNCRVSSWSISRKTKTRAKVGGKGSIYK